MGNKIKCLNCNKLIPSTKYKFCPFCGQSASVERISAKVVLEGVLNAFNFDNNRILYTLKSMLSNPGETMLDYLEGGRHKYQNPISFLFLSLFFYGLIINYLVAPQGNYIGVIMIFNQFKLVFLMAGLSGIGWVISGRPRFNYYETFIIFSFVYGTSFFITPIFTLIQVEIEVMQKMKSLPKITKFLASDFPSILFIFYCLASFFKAAKISWFRFALTGVVGLAYYLFFIEEFAK